MQKNEHRHCGSRPFSFISFRFEYKLKTFERLRLWDVDDARVGVLWLYREFHARTQCVSVANVRAELKSDAYDGEGASPRYKIGILVTSRDRL